MKNWLLIAVACLGLSACDRSTTDEVSEASVADPAAIEAETARLNEWFEEKYEEEVQLSPVTLTFLGRKEQYDKIDDLSEAAEQANLDWRRKTVEEMESSFDYDLLTAEAQLSYDLWKYQYEDEASGAEFTGNDYVFEQSGAIQSFMTNFLINFHRIESESDFQAFVARIGGMATAMDQLLVRARKYAANGVRPPLFAYEGVLEQAEKIIGGAPFDEKDDSAIWAHAQSAVDGLVASEAIDEARADELRQAARAALLEHFMPAYQRLIVWVKEDMPNADVIATGVGKQPNGKAYYNRQLRTSTTTDMTADEIHELGLAEVARIRKLMIEIKDQVEFDGSLAEFFAFIREDEQFYFPDTDEGRQMYIDGAKERLAFIEERLPEFFGILPKAELVVKRVEPFREQDGAAQHYYPGTPDGSRPGVYYAHLSDMKAMPTNQLEVIAYHEGSPGHHMQISIAQELTSVPTFRTQAGFTAYSEGWGLYSELLAKEMGAYEDPYSDFGRLTTEIWRAVRLVVDTGLHAKGWTEQEAMDYFAANTPEPIESIRSEVRRYIVTPGQATSYKIGMLKILELREKAKNALGDKFDIRGFHDTILGGGALPLSLLERRVDNWIASQG